MLKNGSQETRLDSGSFMGCVTTSSHKLSELAEDSSCLDPGCSRLQEPWAGLGMQHGAQDTSGNTASPALRAPTLARGKGKGRLHCSFLLACQGMLPEMPTSVTPRLP
jgi:hypothetical protein